MTILTSTKVAAGDDVLASQQNSILDDILTLGGDAALATGSSNAFAVTLNSEITSYTTYALYKFIANHTITGAATLNINSLGAKSIKDARGNALIAGDIVSGQTVAVLYDGTDLIIISQMLNFGTNPGQIPEILTGSKLDALDGSNLTNVKTNVYVGTFTHNAASGSGNQDITSPGFDPTSVEIFAYFGGTEPVFCNGYSDFTRNYCVHRYESGAAQFMGLDSSKCVHLELNGVSGDNQVASASQVTNGFRLAWTVTGSPGDVIGIYIAKR